MVIMAVDIMILEAETIVAAALAASMPHNGGDGTSGGCGLKDAVCDAHMINKGEKIDC